jgi:hypothetical protein
MYKGRSLALFLGGFFVPLVGCVVHLPRFCSVLAPSIFPLAITAVTASPASLYTPFPLFYIPPGIDEHGDISLSPAPEQYLYIYRPCHLVTAVYCDLSAPSQTSAAHIRARESSLEILIGQANSGRRNRHGWVWQSFKPFLYSTGNEETNNARRSSSAEFVGVSGWSFTEHDDFEPHPGASV